MGEAATPAPPGDRPPVAQVSAAGSGRLIWIVPLAAILLAGWLGFRAWSQRGLIVTVSLREGHGLKEGDAVRYRGIAVGRVREVLVAPDGGGVVVVAGLHVQGRLFARAGSRFWVVRPQVGLDRVEGLETLMGPRCMAALPGDGAAQRHFVGLDEPPAVESIEPGDLEIILQAPRRSGMRVGAPVTYRQVRVGTILSVGLTSDAGAVEARVHIQKPYAQIVRPSSRFWPVRGVRAEVGLKGVSLELDQLQGLLIGGVEMATPADSSPPVRTGHRFTLDERPEEAWLEWDPMVAVGSALLPAGAMLPAPLRATIGWREGLLRTRRRIAGWVVPTDRGLLGPANLLTPPQDARSGSGGLEVAGREVALSAPRWTDGRLALLDFDADRPWPVRAARAAAAPQECLVVGDPLSPPVPLAAARMRDEGGWWSIDSSVSFDRDWHGAAVLARSDGALVGILLVDDDGRPSVAALPAGWSGE
jgi:hypothetical protein